MERDVFRELSFGERQQRNGPELTLKHPAESRSEYTGTGSARYSSRT